MATDESTYRKTVEDLYRRIEFAFETIDPDVAECENALGALTINLGTGSKIILSSQPSVRQVWLANAARGVAYHFNFDPKKGRWMDDKNKGIELLECLKGFVSEATSLRLTF